eukprot:jgi/Mesvir1/25191/Mv12890-RA.1
MGPKKGAKTNDSEVASPLQAVVLADTFSQRFYPITEEMPKVLLPLCNVPLINYTLEWLYASGVEEVYVLCCAHAKMVQRHIAQSKWASMPNFSVTCFVGNSVSVGDALRLLDQKNVIRGDFVLVTGDTVANMSLDKVIAAHKERRRRDKLAIMTMVFSRIAPDARLAQLGDSELVITYDSQTKQLVSYNDTCSFSVGGSANVKVDTGVFEDHSSVDVRYDLHDCYIDICAPELLFLFTDNFDYQHIRRDFVKGILSDDVMGNQIHVYELANEYARRVLNLRGYDAASRDVISRWTFPYVPDTNVMLPGTTYKYMRCNVYKEDDVTIARSAMVDRNCVLGRGSKVGEHAHLSNSVLGRGCELGARSVVDGSYLFDNVQVGDKAVIRNAIVCEGAVIMSGARVEPGSIISHRVVVGRGFVVPPFSMLSMSKQKVVHDNDSDDELEYATAGGGNSVSDRSEGSSKEDEDEEEEEEEDEDEEGSRRRPGEGDGASGAQAGAGAGGSKELSDGEQPPEKLWDEKVVGPGGRGHAWTRKLTPGQEDEELLFSSLYPAPPALARILSFLDKLPSKEGEEAAAAQAAVRQGGAEASDEEVDEDRIFVTELEETFLRGVDQNLDLDNVVLELHGLKMAYNRSFAECAGVLFRLVIKLALDTHKPAAGTKALLQGIEASIKRWAPLLRRFMTTEDDQVEIILSFEEYCEDEDDLPEGQPRLLSGVFSQVLQIMYSLEVISGDAVLKWAEEKTHAAEEDKRYLAKCTRFLEWLNESEESEDEEDEDEEEKESEDDDEEEEKKPAAAKPAPTPAAPAKTAAAAAAAAAEDDDDDDDEEEDEEEEEEEDEGSPRKAPAKKPEPAASTGAAKGPAAAAEEESEESEEEGDE